LGYGPVAGFCKHNDEISDSKTAGNITRPFGQLSAIQGISYTTELFKLNILIIILSHFTRFLRLN
jgi:hypothetical protein